MKLIIYGATGTIGRQLVQQALNAGHQVTAFARSKAKLQDVQHPNFKVFEGDVLNPQSVALSIEGQDVALCALGAGRKGVVRSEGTKNIIRGMEAKGIRRLICQTTLGAGDSKGNLNFFWKHIMFGWFLKDAMEDHELQEHYIRQSNLDWTIIRPAAFQDGDITGRYKHGFTEKDKSISLKISRADVAHFMLQQLGSNQYLRKTSGLSYTK